MISFLRWILGLAMIAAAVFFALANRDAVPVNWSPFHPALDMPVFAVGLGGLMLGMVAGAFMIWLEGREQRCDIRRHRRMIRTLEEELNGERTRDAESIGTPAPSGIAGAAQATGIAPPDGTVAAAAALPPPAQPYFRRGGRALRPGRRKGRA